MRERELVSRTFDFKNSSGRETRASEREREREKVLEKSREKVIGKKMHLQMYLLARYTYMSNDDTRRNRGPDLCHVRTSVKG